MLSEFGLCVDLKVCGIEWWWQYCVFFVGFYVFGSDVFEQVVEDEGGGQVGDWIWVVFFVVSYDDCIFVVC